MFKRSHRDMGHPLAWIIIYRYWVRARAFGWHDSSLISRVLYGAREP